jgi:hypothetical protein
VEDEGEVWEREKEEKKREWCAGEMQPTTPHVELAEYRAILARRDLIAASIGVCPV